MITNDVPVPVVTVNGLGSVHGQIVLGNLSLKKISKRLPATHAAHTVDRAFSAFRS